MFNQHSTSIYVRLSVLNLTHRESERVRFRLSDVKGEVKVVSVLNESRRHEDVLGEWKYGSIHY